MEASRHATSWCSGGRWRRAALGWVSWERLAGRGASRGASRGDASGLKSGRVVPVVSQRECGAAASCCLPAWQMDLPARSWVKRQRGSEAARRGVGRGRGMALALGSGSSGGSGSSRLLQRAAGCRLSTVDCRGQGREGKGGDGGVPPFWLWVSGAGGASECGGKFGECKRVPAFRCSSWRASICRTPARWARMCHVG
jgi:hypothetical protein